MQNYPPPSPDRPTGSGLFGQTGNLPGGSLARSVDGSYSRRCYEAHLEFKMLDKARLGVEDKMIAPGVNGPGTIRCKSCGHTSMYMTSGPLPAACPDCGKPVEVVKGD
jgi:Zn finger protein HypA/HybF involved in hydrogenase expression